MAVRRETVQEPSRLSPHLDATTPIHDRADIVQSRGPDEASMPVS
jgi:hypothetical protein